MNAQVQSKENYPSCFILDSKMFLLLVPLWVIKVWMKWIYVKLFATAEPPDVVFIYTSLYLKYHALPLKKDMIDIHIYCATTMYPYYKVNP